MKMNKLNTSIAATVVFISTAIAAPANAEGLKLGNGQNTKDTAGIQLNESHLIKKNEFAYDNASIINQLNEQRDNRHFRRSATTPIGQTLEQRNEKFKHFYELQTRPFIWE